MVFLHYILSFISFGEFWSRFLIAVRSIEGLHGGAEPGFEIRAAVKQANTLPTELRHTLAELRHTLIELRHTFTELHHTELRQTLNELRYTLWLSFAIPFWLPAT